MIESTVQTDHMIIGAQVDAEVKRQSNRVKEILLANSVRRTEFSIKRHHSSRPSINMISLETCMKLLMVSPIESAKGRVKQSRVVRGRICNTEDKGNVR